MNICWGKRALIFTLSSLSNFHRNPEAAAYLPVPQGNLLGKRFQLEVYVWNFKRNLLYLEFWLVLIQYSLLCYVFSSLFYILLLSRPIYLFLINVFTFQSVSLFPLQCLYFLVSFCHFAPVSIYLFSSLRLSMCLWLSLHVHMHGCMYVCLCMRICLIQLPRRQNYLSVLSQSLTTWIIDWELFTPWYISYQKRTERCWNFL